MQFAAFLRRKWLCAGKTAVGPMSAMGWRKIQSSFAGCLGRRQKIDFGRLDYFHRSVLLPIMARQISYNPTEVRSRLLSKFWDTGYAETSLSDLEEATGLNRRQLYNGLGNKKAMFLSAVDDFSTTAGRQFLGPLEKDTAGLDEIASLLRTFVALAGSKDGPSGCMVCSVSQEEIADDVDVRPRIDAYFDRIEAAYRNALTQAAVRGEINLAPPAISAKSAHLFGVHVALCVLGRAGCAQNKLHRIAEEAINSAG